MFEYTNGAKSAEREEENAEAVRRLRKIHSHVRERKEYISTEYDRLIVNEGYSESIMGRYAVDKLLSIMLDYQDDFPDQIDKCRSVLKDLRNSK